MNYIIESTDELHELIEKAKTCLLICQQRVEDIDDDAVDEGTPSSITCKRKMETVEMIRKALSDTKNFSQRFNVDVEKYIDNFSAEYDELVPWLNNKIDDWNNLPNEYK